MGGGFGGVATARGLEGRADVVLISEVNYLLFTPMLAEVAAADVDPRHILTPIRDMCRRTRLVVGRVVSVDGSKRSVVVRSPIDGTETAYSGDALVIATGSDSATYGIPGVAEHTMAFRTIGDALSIRHRLLGLLDDADARPRPDATTVAIIGAGAAGAELSAALADFLRRTTRRYFPSAPEPRVILIDAIDRVLPQLPKRASVKASRALRRRKVEMGLGRRVIAVLPGVVILDGDMRVEAATIVWAGGIRGRQVPGKPGAAPGADGRYVVDDHLRIAPGVWGLGDVVRSPDGHGGISPPTAQHALRQGAYLGRNLPALLRGEVVAPFRYRTMGELVSLGHRSAVGRVLGVTVSGFLGWFLWRSYYLFRLPGMLRRIRVAFDWTLDLVFPPDVADPATAGRGPDLGESA